MTCHEFINQNDKTLDFKITFTKTLDKVSIFVNNNPVDSRTVFLIVLTGLLHRYDKVMLH